jgi:hypothetical protein
MWKYYIFVAAICISIISPTTGSARTKAEKKPDGIVPEVFVENHTGEYEYIDLAQTIFIDIKRKTVKFIRILKKEEIIDEYKITRIDMRDTMCVITIDNDKIEYNTENKTLSFKGSEFIPLNAIGNKRIVFTNCHVYEENRLNLKFNKDVADVAKNIWSYYCPVDGEQKLKFDFYWKNDDNVIELFVEMDNDGKRTTYKVRQIHDDGTTVVLSFVSGNLLIISKRGDNYLITGPGFEESFYGCI